MTRLDFNYAGLLPEDGFYLEKAKRICRLYATKIRMAVPRAIEVRYAFPYTEHEWPMVGQSVAEHAFMVAQMCTPIYLEFLDLFRDKSILPERLEAEALHHDDAEALTGDVATGVDGVTRVVKEAVEPKSLERQYGGLACYSYMRLRFEVYEGRETYLSKIVKMLDALDLVFFTQYCVRNGVGIIARQGIEDGYVLKYPGGQTVVNRRVHREIEEYLVRTGRQEVPIAEIMYDHSLPRVESLRCPELTGLFKLLSSQAFEFPFEEYSLAYLPMDFANLVN